MWQKPLKQDDKWRKQYWMIIGNCVKRRFMKSFDWLKNIVVSRERNSNHCCSLDKGKTVFTVRTHPVLEEFCVVSWTKVDRRWKLECEDPWQWTMQYTCTHVTVHLYNSVQQAWQQLVFCADVELSLGNIQDCDHSRKTQETSLSGLPINYTTLANGFKLCFSQKYKKSWDDHQYKVITNCWETTSFVE